MGEREKLEDERVVVEHLLEMRDQPALVHRIAREPSAEMVVDAAFRHARERKLDQAEIALITQPQAGAPEKLEHHGLRELGCAAHPAADRVDQARDLIGDAIELGPADRRAPAWLGGFGKARHDGAAVMLHAVWLLAEDALDLAQE